MTCVHFCEQVALAQTIATDAKTARTRLGMAAGARTVAGRSSVGGRTQGTARNAQHSGDR